MFLVTGLEFKTFDLAEEWDKSGWTDPLLRAITCYLAFYCYKEFKKSWIVTQIGRGEQEQIQLYPDYFQKYNKAKFSKHCLVPVQAIDARSHHLEKHEIEELKAQFHKQFVKMGGDSTLFRYHQGTAFHCHYQV